MCSLQIQNVFCVIQTWEEKSKKKKKCNKYLRDNILQVIAIYKVTK